MEQAPRCPAGGSAEGTPGGTRAGPACAGTGSVRPGGDAFSPGDAAGGKSCRPGSGGRLRQLSSRGAGGYCRGADHGGSRGLHGLVRDHGMRCYQKRLKKTLFIFGKILYNALTSENFISSTACKENRLC